MRILGFDPGPRNFGFVVADMDKRMTILEIGQITSTITNLTPSPAYKKPTKAMRERAKKRGERLKKTDQPFEPPLQEGFDRFHRVIIDLLDQYKPSVIIMERFQSRGLKGAVIECISIMIGIVMTLAKSRGIRVRLVTAAQWKNEINKVENLEGLYAMTATFGFTPHETDTLGMSVYLKAEQVPEAMEWIRQKKIKKALTRYMNVRS